MRPYKAPLWIMTFMVAVASLMELLTPLYYKKFFDLLSKAGDKASALPGLIHIISIIFALNFVMWLAYRSGTFFNNTFQAGVMANLRKISFDYLIQHSYEFFTNNFVGSLVQKVNRLARAFERFADRMIWNVFPLGIRIVGVSIALWFISPAITFIILVWAAVFIFFNFFFSRWKLKYDLQRAELDSRSTGVLADDITNQTTIQLFTGFKKESENYQNVLEDQRRITKFTLDLDAVVDAVQAFLIICVEFVIFYFALPWWEKGIFTIGTFVLIQTYLIGLIGRLWDFTRVIRDIYQSSADAKEMVEILYLPHEIQDTLKAKTLRVPSGEIKFENVSFAFHQTRPVLKNINLTIRAGEKVALVGPSGAGKSTIVKLLFRFYDVVSGEIKIDGQNIQKITQESLRHNLSLVPQDPILFHRTLMENIRYGKRDASDEEVKRVAGLAHCEEFINGLPKGYETYVGERGIKLSGGERQRVAIARAMLKNAPILILDEATSSLDSHSETMIQDGLEKLMKGRTTVVIAHRLSTIRKMDRIIVIDEGEIKEEGTHESLIADPHGLYKKLWTLQAGGFLQEDEEDEDEIISEKAGDPETEDEEDTRLLGKDR